MRIGPIVIKLHRHKWEKKIVDQWQNGHLSYVIKVAEVCVSPDHSCNWYRSVYFIHCKNKPEAFLVD